MCAGCFDGLCRGHGEEDDRLRPLGTVPAAPDLAVRVGCWLRRWRLVLVFEEVNFCPGQGLRAATSVAMSNVQ